MFVVIVSGTVFTCFSMTAAEAAAPNVLLDMKLLLNRFLGRVNVRVSKYLSSSVIRNIQGQKETTRFLYFSIIYFDYRLQFRPPSIVAQSRECHRSIHHLVD